jgi:hypothetical protein
MNTIISVGVPLIIFFLLYIAVAGSMPDAMDKEVKKWEQEEKRRATNSKTRIHY